MIHGVDDLQQRQLGTKVLGQLLFQGLSVAGCDIVRVFKYSSSGKLCAKLSGLPQGVVAFDESQRRPLICWCPHWMWILYAPRLPNHVVLIELQMSVRCKRGHSGRLGRGSLVRASGCGVRSEQGSGVPLDWTTYRLCHRERGSATGGGQTGRASRCLPRCIE